MGGGGCCPLVAGRVKQRPKILAGSSCNKRELTRTCWNKYLPKNDATSQNLLELCGTRTCRDLQGPTRTCWDQNLREPDGTYKNLIGSWTPTTSWNLMRSTRTCWNQNLQEPKLAGSWSDLRKPAHYSGQSIWDVFIYLFILVSFSSSSRIGSGSGPI